MSEIQTTCYWLEDRCDGAAVGFTSHPVHGVIPICARCQAASGAPLIKTDRHAGASR
jgi:hypothetical protein